MRWFVAAFVLLVAVGCVDDGSAESAAIPNAKPVPKISHPVGAKHVPTGE